MEGLILIGLVLVGGMVILPVAAFIRSGRAIREAESLQEKIALLEIELRRLRPAARSEWPEPAVREAITSEPPLPTEPPELAPADFRDSVGPAATPHGPPTEPIAASAVQSVGGGEATPTSAPPLPPPVPEFPPVMAASTPVSAPSGPQAPVIDWEKFMGVKLFAWLGG